MKITPHALFSISLVALVLALAPAARAQQPNAAKATPLMSKDLPDFAGKEVTMSTVEYAPGGTSAPRGAK